MINVNEFSINDYLHKTFSCRCGKEHHAELSEVIIEPGAITKTGELVKKYGYKTVLLVSDINTYRIAGEKTLCSLEAEGIQVINFIYEDKELVPDEKSYESLYNALTEQCEFVIAVGSGTINDLCKYLSFQKNLEYMIVATAPSMDGFASTVAPMIVANMKVTFEARVAKIILADLTILKESPMSMIAAGVGDILGKYTCLCDWKMANFIKNEYYCETIADMIRKSIKTVVDNIEKAIEREEGAIKSIMEALVLSGIAMSFSGNSRPASGSEHHLSHYWEMMFLQENRKPILHGTKVGIGTVTVLRIYEYLISHNVDFDKARSNATAFSEKEWESLMKTAYGSAAEGVLALEKKVHKNSPENVVAALDDMEEKWGEILTFIKAALPGVAEVKRLLESMNAPSKPAQVEVSSETVKMSIRVAKELRDRFGVLQMIFNLGIMDEIIEAITVVTP